MSYDAYQSGGYPSIVIQAPETARAQFMRRTYAHLAGAILAFVGLEFLMFQSGIADRFMSTLRTSPGAMIGVLIAFIVASFVADWWARSDTSKGMQYAGLALYVLVEAIIFVPLLSFANDYAKLNPNDTNMIAQAGVMTLAVFAGLTATVFLTKSDYSFLGPIISIASFAALGFIIAGILFGFSLGLAFSLFMVAIASASILYETSNIMYRYRTDQYVAASLGLFASVALLFYYILRIFLASRD